MKFLFFTFLCSVSLTQSMEKHPKGPKRKNGFTFEEYLARHKKEEKNHEENKTNHEKTKKGLTVAQFLPINGTPDLKQG